MEADSNAQAPKLSTVPWNKIKSIPEYKDASLEQKRAAFKNWYALNAQAIGDNEETLKYLNQAADKVREDEDLGATLGETLGDLAIEIGFPVVAAGIAAPSGPGALLAAGAGGAVGNTIAQNRRIARGDQFDFREGELIFNSLANAVPLGKLSGGIASRLLKEGGRQAVIGGAADVGAQVVDTGEVDPRRALINAGASGVMGAGFELPFALLDRPIANALPKDKDWAARVEGRSGAPIEQLIAIARDNPDELSSDETAAVIEFINAQRKQADTPPSAAAPAVVQPQASQGISQAAALSGLADIVPTEGVVTPFDTFMSSQKAPSAAAEADNILGSNTTLESVNAAANEAAGVTPVGVDGPVGQQASESAGASVEPVTPAAYGRVEEIDGEFVVYDEDGGIIDVLKDEVSANDSLNEYRTSLLGEDVNIRPPLTPDDEIVPLARGSESADRFDIDVARGVDRVETKAQNAEATFLKDRATGESQEAFARWPLERLTKRLRAIDAETRRMLDPKRAKSAAALRKNKAKADELTIEGLEIRARMGDERATAALTKYRNDLEAFNDSPKPNQAVLDVLDNMKWDGPIPAELVQVGVPARWADTPSRLTDKGKAALAERKANTSTRLRNVEGKALDGSETKFDEVLHEFSLKLEQAGYVPPSQMDGGDGIDQVDEALNLISRAMSEGAETPPAVPSVPYTPEDEARILAPFDEVFDALGTPVKRPSRASGDDLPPAPEDTIFQDLDSGEVIKPASGRKMREAIKDSIYSTGSEVEPRIIRTRDRLANALADTRPEIKEQKLERLLYDLEANAVARERIDPADRIRGADYLRERIYNAKRNEDISPDTADFAIWALDKNPSIADDLGISLRTPKDRDRGTSGTYNPFNRVVTLFKGGENWTTGVHEILHHAEQLMPEDMREKIRRSWSKALAKRIAGEKDDAKRAIFEKMVLAESGDLAAAKAVDEAFLNKKLTYEDYHLANPSEYWAVKATSMARSKFEDDGLWARAGRFVLDMIEYFKDALGLDSTAPIIRALNKVLDGSYGGKPQARAMISNRIKYFNDLAKKTDDEQRKQLLKMVRENDAIVKKALAGTPYEGVSSAVAQAIGRGADDGFDPVAKVRELEAAADKARAGSQKTIKEKITSGVHFLEQKFLSQNAFANRIADAIERAGVKKFRAGDDPRMLFTTRGMNHQSIASGYIRQSGITQFVQDIAAKAKQLGQKPAEYIAELDQYLIAKQALQRYALGATEGEVGGGMTQEVAENLVASLAKKHEEDARFVNTVFNDLLEKAVEGGLVSRDLADALTEMFPDYVPFHRIFNEDEIAEGMSSYTKGGKAVGSIGRQDLVKRFVGSQRMIESPMEEMFSKAYATVAQIERNRVARSLASLGDNPVGEAMGIRALYRLNEDGSPLIAEGPAIKLAGKNAGFLLAGADGKPIKDQNGEFVKLTREYVEQGEDGKYYGNGKVVETADISDVKHKISFMDNGRRLDVEVPKELEEVAKGLNVPEMGLFFNVFNLPVRLGRAGFTGLNVIFGLRQLPRDLAQVIANTTNFREVPRVVGAYADGIKSAFGQRLGVDTPLFRRWEEYGGRFNFSEAFRDPTKSRATVSRVIGNIPFYSRPAQAFRKLEDALAAFEDMTRLSVFKAEVNRQAKEAIDSGANIRFDKDDYLTGDQDILDDIFAKAAYESQERTANYLNRGEWGRALNGVFLFLNAGLQGTRANVKAFKANPTAYLLKTTMMGGAGLAAVTAYNLSDPDRAEAYMNLTEDDRERNIIILSPTGAKDEQGNYHAIRIPLPQGISGLLQTPRRAIEDIYGFSQREGDPNMFTSFVKDVIGFVTPFEPEPEKMLSTIVPQAVRPALEVGVINRSLFTGQAVVPKYLEDTLPADQYTSKTSATARAIGQALNISPIKLETLARGYAGSLAQTAFWAADKVVGPATGVEPRGQSIPEQIIASFGRARGGEQMNRFYANLEDADEVYRSIKVAADRGNVERANAIAEENPEVLATYEMLRTQSAAMSNIYKTIRTLESQIDTNPEAKADIVQLRSALVDIATAVNEQVDNIRRGAGE